MKPKLQTIIYCKQRKMFFAETDVGSGGPFETFDQLIKKYGTIEDIPITAVAYY